MGSLKIRAFVALSIIALIAIGLFLIHEVRGNPPDRPLTIMTLNVGTFNSKVPDMNRVAELIGRTGSLDILLLQEVSDALQARKLADDLRLMHCIFTPYASGRDGLAVISRFPLRMVHFFQFIRYGAMAVEADIGNRKMLLLTVHLKRVADVWVSETEIDLSWKKAFKILKRELTQETPRTRAVKELLAWISAQPYEDIIIAGDFNTVPFSKTIRTISGRFKDALWPGLNYFKGSYKNLPFSVEPRIDYIFHSPTLKCFSADIIADSSGDHFPVKAIFDMPEKTYKPILFGNR
jgi:endonuclease/exonuclease/phosphatase family metal-dependent hydrolase